jgi:mannosyl-3-phosphoglycerate phosphatase
MYLVFTDADGTVLDHDTYSYQSAEPGILLLRERNIPLILVSSKTLSEMRNLHKELALSYPFVFENGGGIFWSDRKEGVEYAGMNISLLKQHVLLLKEVLHEEVRFITDMTVSELAKATGLSRELARLSQQRTSSLPFMFKTERKIGIDELESINNALNPYGFAVTKGDRFFYFSSNNADKGSAVKKIIDYYRMQFSDEIKTIGIGDSENDVPMFRAVDIPVIVKKPDGAAIRTGLSNIVATRGIGPSGFTEAVTSIITGKT